MKIYINRRPVTGPWGGGSKVLSAIVDECNRRGHDVFFEEEIRNGHQFDVLFCIDPRPNIGVSFDELIWHKYAHKTKIIQRIGDLGTHGKPDLFLLVRSASDFSDVLVFPSQWAKSYFNPTRDKHVKVIENAPLPNFLQTNTRSKPTDTISIVSHHWSDNTMKGFDTYEALDNYCKKSSLYDFTFIGRKPAGVTLENYVPPQDIDGLVAELPKHHVYITASKFEAGANHVLEALGLGLPMLYHKDGGSINEYCKNYGLLYESNEDLINLLETREKDLRSLIGTIIYKRSSVDMAKEYVDLFEEIK